MSEENWGLLALGVVVLPNAVFCVALVWEFITNSGDKTQ